MRQLSYDSAKCDTTFFVSSLFLAFIAFFFGCFVVPLKATLRKNSCKVESYSKVKFSPENTEDCPRIDFHCIHEISSREFSSRDEGFLVDQRGLCSVLESFVGLFMNQERRIRQALQDHANLKVKCHELWKEDVECSVIEKIDSKSYPMTVTSGDMLDKKVSLPVSPHGIFVQVPTSSYISFCRQKSQQNPTGIVTPLPQNYCDEISYAYERTTMPPQLYGFALILNSSVFIDSSSDCGDHLVLCILSRLPEFLFTKQLVVSVASMLHTTAVQKQMRSRTVSLDNLLKNNLAELAPLLDEKADCSMTFPGQKIELPFLTANKFMELRRSTALCARMTDAPFSTLLLSFNYDALRQLHTLLLQEQRIIFVGCNPQHASACAVSAPSLVFPFRWVAPLIPFLHARGTHSTLFLDTLFAPPLGTGTERVSSCKMMESSGFIVGTTWELIPPLALRWSALIAKHKGCSSEIWVADARTGNIGLLPVDLPPVNVANVGRSILVPAKYMCLLPTSDKLQNSYNAAIKEPNRAAFRSVVSYFSQLRRTVMILEAHNTFLRRLINERNSSGLLYFDQTSGIVEQWKANVASAAYSCPKVGESLIVDVHAAFLEYNTHRTFGEYRKGMNRTSTSIKFDSDAFLLSRLHSKELVKQVAETHMHKQFSYVIAYAEATGVAELLQSRAPPRGPNSHPFLESPTEVAGLCLFYSRARNRFPELFPDLSGAVLSNACITQIGYYIQAREVHLKDVKWAASSIFPTIVSLAGTATDGTQESKGSVLKFFSKASKAVKKFQNGEEHFVIVPQFTQAFNSFCAMPSSTDSGTSSVSPQIILKKEYECPEIRGEKPSWKHESAAFLPPCRRLPLDVVHNFGSYHRLLNSLHSSPYTTFIVPDMIEELSESLEKREKTDFFMGLGLLLPSSQRMWKDVGRLIGSQMNNASKYAVRTETLAVVPTEVVEARSEIVADNSSKKASQDVPESSAGCAAVAPSLSDLFEGPASPGAADGFSSGIPNEYAEDDGFSSGVPTEPETCRFVKLLQFFPAPGSIFQLNYPLMHHALYHLYMDRASSLSGGRKDAGRPIKIETFIETERMMSSQRDPLVPSINFAMVCPGVYRSGYPTKKNFSFLRAVALKTILYLCPEDYAESNLKFCEEEKINVLRFPTEGNKEPFNDISESLMHRIMSAVSDTRNFPLLIHCNKGKHRTGTVVACLRHLQGWALVSIFEEYKRFAGDKARVGDQQYIELYYPIVLVDAEFAAPWLCHSSRVQYVSSLEELQEAESQQLRLSLLAPDEIKKQPKSDGAHHGSAQPATPSEKMKTNAPQLICLIIQLCFKCLINEKGVQRSRSNLLLLTPMMVFPRCDFSY
eukprot:gene9087-6380_t